MANPPAKKTYRKKIYRKKKYIRKPRKLNIPTAPATHTIVKLRYTDNITFSSLLGSIGSKVYRINDLYDPDYTGTGHQSYFRDQLFTMYQYGRVLWASIKITAVSYSATQPYEIILAPIQSPTGTADTNMNTASERKGSRSCYLNGNQAVKTLRCSSSCDNYFGQKRGATIVQASMAQLSTASLALYNSMWYEIIFNTLDNASAGLYFKVDIEQITRFEQPLQQSGS